MSRRAKPAAFRERQEQDVAELPPPRGPEVAVEPRDVVHVDDPRDREAPSGRRRLRLLEMDDVRRGGKLAKAGCERPPPELAARFGVRAEMRAHAVRVPRHLHHLDGQVGRRVAGRGERLPGSNSANVEPVCDQAAEEPDRALAGRTAVGERRLRERDGDDEAGVGRHGLASLSGPRNRCADVAVSQACGLSGGVWSSSLRR
jgi:hypothetical protein